MKVNALFRSLGNKARLVAGSLVMFGATAAPAMADAIDTTGIITAVTGAAAAVALVGAAIVAGPKIGVKVYKWLSGAL